jgi:hypothetical protein
VQASAVLGEVRFTMGARPGRRARVVRQALRALRGVVGHGASGPIEMTCLQAHEVGAPAGEKPVCWRLLTNRLAPDLACAQELIEWYRARWEIEMFFHVLKTGCRVEALPLASLAKIERALALFMVVSWRIARTPPSLNDVVRRVAMLGGFLARKGDGEPGVKTLWIGLQRVMDFATGVRFMRQSSAKLGCV